MATLHLRRAYDPNVLLEAAAEEFLQPTRASRAGEAFPSPACLLALRQGGLRDDLLELAARRGVPGWFDPPLCTFQELPERLGAGAARPLGAFERVALIGALVRRVGGEVLARLRRPEAYLAALDRLFGELAAEGVSADALETAQAASTLRDDFSIRRDTEITEVYREYLDVLGDKGRRDGRDSLAACASSIRSDPEGLAERLGGRRRINLLGLQDLRGGWRGLLAALRDCTVVDEVVIYTSVELDLEGLGATSERLPERDSVAGRLFLPGGEGTSTAVHVHASDHVHDRASQRSGRAPRHRDQHDLFQPLAPAEPPASRADSIDAIVAPDAQREVEEVAARARALVDRGVQPYRIAVVAREARPQLAMATAALRRFGLPVTARERTGLGEVPAVRGLLALLDVAAEGWTRHGLVELADQPYLGVELDGSVIDNIGYRERVLGLDTWAAAFERLLAEARERERRRETGDADENEHQRPLPPLWRIERTVEQLLRIRERFTDLDQSKSLRDWLGWLRRVLDDEQLDKAIYRAPLDSVIRLDLAALKAVRGIAQEWAQALDDWGGGEEALEVNAFAARLRDELDADVALWTETRRGVQVLEAPAAAYRAFEHVFVVGLEAGRFPRAPARSPLLDTVEREALIAAGLPLDGRAAWETRERELFRSVVACGGHLTVSYARLDASAREVAASSFVEAVEDVATLEREALPVARVLTPGLPLCRPERLADVERNARLERRRQAGQLFAGNGAIEDATLRDWLAAHFGDERIWSATQLEEFAKCPWAFFCGRVLRLERQQDPDTEMDPAVRGTILHDTLRRFFDAAVARAGGPVLLAEQHRAWAEPELLRALDAALAAAGDEAWLGHPALRAARREELGRLIVRYLDWEIGHNASLFNNRANASRSLRTGVIEHEKVFDDIVLERDGVRFRFRGRIDRVEIGIDERVRGDVAHFVAAVDYKSSRWATPAAGNREAWDEGIVLQVPLYAYALAQLWPGAEVARVEYRTLKSPDIVLPLELVQVDRNDGNVLPSEEAEVRLEQALAAAAAHVKAIREGRFPAATAPHCDCTPWCPGRDICRSPSAPGER